jgi:hypothetical protein
MSVPTKTVTATDTVKDVLRTATFEPNGIGYLGVLNCGQLDRATYAAVNAVLDKLGGKWNRKQGGHLFESDPRPQVDELLGTGAMTIARDGYFPTPLPVVERMLALAGLEDAHIVLEPSAGIGHIAGRVRPLVARVDVIELDAKRRATLQDKGYNVVGTDFLAFNGTYPRILMNPPFENRQDVEHVSHAFQSLTHGGRVVAVMAAGVTFRTDKKTAAFRDYFLKPFGKIEALPPDAFKESGTSVNTCLVVLRKDTP